LFCCWLDLPAGHPVKLLVGFSNKGSQEFIVETMDAAFRYPQDYSFYIQNVRSSYCTSAAAVKFSFLLDGRSLMAFISTGNVFPASSFSSFVISEVVCII